MAQFTCNSFPELRHFFFGDDYIQNELREEKVNGAEEVLKL